MSNPFFDDVDKAEKEYKKPSEWFKIEEGPNQIRILTRMEVLPQHFSKSGYKGICIGKDEGCPGCKEGSDVSIKWLCWIIDRKDELLKIAQLPHTVVKTLQLMQEDEEYQFDDFPMPYDVKINAKDAGTKEVKYTVTGGRSNSAVPVEVVTALEEKLKTSSPLQIKDKLKKKAMEVSPRKNDSMTPVDYPEGPDPEKIPF